MLLRFPVFEEFLFLSISRIEYLSIILDKRSKRGTRPKSKKSTTYFLIAPITKDFGVKISKCNKTVYVDEIICLFVIHR